jgi:hypothetical protein
MLDQLRDAMRGLSDRLAPEERRRVAASMKDALVHAKMALQDLRSAIATTEQRLAAERTELQTVERRLGLAEQINDQETVAIARRFAAQHGERVSVLETKLMSQQQELTLGERELDEMSQQLRRALSGLPINASSPERDAMHEVESALGNDGESGSAAADEARRILEEPPRRTRAEKEAEAEERLAQLKRRMGK